VKTDLFAEKTTLVLSNSEHKRISSAKLDLWTTLRATYHGRLFTNNFPWSLTGFAASIAVIAATGFAYSKTYGSSASGILAGMLIPLLPIMISAAMMRSGVRQDSRAGQWRFMIGLIVVTISAVVGIVIMGFNAGFGPAILPGILAYVLAALATQAFFWLQAPSRAGRKVMDQIEGFKQYLDVAEEERLDFLHPPEKTPELFEKFLPYAIALGVENRWAERFIGVLAVAGVGAAVSSWYTGSSSHTDNATSFADRLSSNLSQTIASAATAPGSSGGGGGSDYSSNGSSGGGSSGGGGGGGGGSGW
jgi:uncharacterized membrane protein YgcG